MLDPLQGFQAFRDCRKVLALPRSQLAQRLAPRKGPVQGGLSLLVEPAPRVQQALLAAVLQPARLCHFAGQRRELPDCRHRRGPESSVLARHWVAGNRGDRG
jgi:hypothetical protein